MFAKAESVFSTSSSPATIYDRVYVQRNKVGLASIHFYNSRSYISFENSRCNRFPDMDNGCRPPLQADFTDATFSSETRTFHGRVSWAPTTWDSEAFRDYELIFSDNFEVIIGGSIKYYTTTGTSMGEKNLAAHKTKYMLWCPNSLHVPDGFCGLGECHGGVRQMDSSRLSDTSTASDLGRPMASLKPKLAIQPDGPANAVKVFSATIASQDDPLDHVSSAGDDFAALCERPFSRLSCGLVTDESLPAWMVGNQSSPSAMSCLPPKPHPLIASWVQAKPSSIESLTRETETTGTMSPETSLPLPD